MKSWLLLLSLFVLALGSGCHDSTADSSGSVRDVPGVSGTMTAAEAGKALYRYAFSGQVIDASNGQPIPGFSLSVLGFEPSAGVVNPLGDANGVFHISRPVNAASTATTVTALVAAVGYRAQLLQFPVANDCPSSACAGTLPVPIPLQIQGGTHLIPTEPPSAEPASLGPLDAERLSTVRLLVATGKVDASLQTALTHPNASEALQNIAVVLQGGDTASASLSVGQILEGIDPARLEGLGDLGQFNASSAVSSLLPSLANSNPQLASSLVAIYPLVSYMASALASSRVDPTSDRGILFGLLSSFGGEGGALKNATSLLGHLRRVLEDSATSEGGEQLASGSLMPLLQAMFGQSEQTSGGTGFVDKLADALLAESGSPRPSPVPQNERLQLLLTYLKPLIQGLAGNNAPALARLFNGLVKDHGVEGLKNFPAILASEEALAPLAPFLAPITKGLLSQDATRLAAAISPLLNKRNPASALRAMVTKTAVGSTANGSQILAALFPSADPLRELWIPAKQRLAAQLFQGLVNGSYEAIHVTQDLPGGPAVIVAASVGDLVKIAQLPYVQKLVVVP